MARVADDLGCEVLRRPTRCPGLVDDDLREMEVKQLELALESEDAILWFQAPQDDVQAVQMLQSTNNAGHVVPCMGLAPIEPVALVDIMQARTETFHVEAEVSRCLAATVIAQDEGGRASGRGQKHEALGYHGFDFVFLDEFCLRHGLPGAELCIRVLDEVNPRHAGIIKDAKTPSGPKREKSVLTIPGSPFDSLDTSSSTSSRAGKRG